MSILELILSDPAAYQQTMQDLSLQQHHWKLFKQHVNALFSPNPPPPHSHSDLWQSVSRSCRELQQPMASFYTNLLYEHLNGQLAQDLCEIASMAGEGQLEMEIGCQLQTVREFLERHQPFLVLLDSQQQHLHIFQQQLYALLKRQELSQKIQKYLSQAFMRHCLDTLSKQVLEFDGETAQFIREGCQEGQNFKLSLSNIRKTLEQLEWLGLLEDYFEPVFQMLNRSCSLFIDEIGDPQFKGQFLMHALKYCRTFLKSYLKSVVCQKTEWLLGRMTSQIEDNCYFLCAKFCIGMILEISFHFPETLQTVLALKKCLDRAPLLSELGENLCEAVRKRLLIPGKIADQILDQYLNMLKILQILDPQGLIFDKITVPIKQYLLKRTDTLRCIISHLTDDGQNYFKLSNQMVKVPSKEYIDEMSSEEDEAAAKEWQVLPVSQNKKKVRIKYQEIDLVTVLVGLYGSQEAFIGEYQIMMAEKLMSARGVNIDEEIRNIELLKKRFGDSALQTCNIIVKDVKDSKRNDGVVHNKVKNVKTNSPLQLSELHTLSVSKGYWPINYESSSTFQLPAGFKGVFEQYADSYAKIKAMRKIFYHYNLGHVNLTLSFDNGDFSFKCAPVQAILITYFDEQRMKKEGHVSSQELSSELQMPPNVVKQKMSFWVHKGVVKEARVARGVPNLRRVNSFQDGEVVNYKPVKVFDNAVGEEIQEDIQGEMVKESASMQSHLKHIIQGLIISILNTNGAKPSEKIHLLLKTVYKTDLDYTYTEIQTVQILKKMVAKKKIIFNGEVYSSKDQ